MKLLRILLLMPVPPLPFGSAAARWFYVLLKGLVERGHRVTAFIVCNNLEEITKVNTLFQNLIMICAAIQFQSSKD
jgi:polysaccharide biosynthesis protein PslH